MKAKYTKLFAGKQPYFGPDVEAKLIPVPTKGWDAISPLSAMDPEYAVVLDNWVPRTGYVEFRGGYNVWAQRVTDTPVETLMAYRPVDAVQQLFAASGTEIWNTSFYGLPTLATSGFTLSRFQYINFTPGGGGASYLAMVNGQDPYTIYNGTTWSQPTITGVSASNLVNINAHKKRIWFIEKESASAWYLGTDAISGTVTEFPLGSFMSKGGFLLAMGTWTVDGGNGPDDLAVFATSQGQLIVYKGTDPSNANAWALVGVFDIPNPIGHRCFCKIGSELAIITQQGLLPVSQSLPFDPSSVRSVAFTNRIQNAMLMAAQNGQSLFGWQVTPFPNQALVFLNVPVEENSNQQQFVMNSITGAWTRFTGWNANCFEIFNNSLYFGDNLGNVNLAYAGSLDLVSPIESDMKCAFNYFDDPGRTKNMRMVRPLLRADGTIIPTISVDVDFSDNSPDAPVVILTPSGALWDISAWDQSQWSSGVITVNNWLSVTALGTALALRMKVNLGGVGTANATAIGSVFDTGTFDTMVFDGNGATQASGTLLVTLQVNAFESIMEFGGPI